MVSRRLSLMIFRPVYEKCGLNPAKPEFFGRFRLSKFAVGYNSFGLT